MHVSSKILQQEKKSCGPSNIAKLELPDFLVIKYVD